MVKDLLKGATDLETYRYLLDLSDQLDWYADRTQNPATALLCRGVGRAARTAASVVMTRLTSGR